MTPRRLLTRLGADAYPLLDRVYRPLDRERLLRTRNLRLIPRLANRRGGKVSYAEWAHVVGIFQTLIATHLPAQRGNLILDVGCGTGLLAIASEPFVTAGDRYVGLDISHPDIAFCRRHYPPAFEFIHLDAANPAYAAHQPAAQTPWPLESGAVDLVTALSVWTHLAEPDARFYLGEVARVLAPGGRAIITFFLLDEEYRRSLPKRSDAPGRFHGTPQSNWIFDRPAYGSSGWFCPRWAGVPEAAIGVRADALDDLEREAGLERAACHIGNWKEVPGVFFQDVLVYKKP